MSRVRSRKSNRAIGPRQSAGRGRSQLAESALRFSTAASPVGAVTLIAIGLAVSWMATTLAGGVERLVPHHYYVVILFAAVRFGPLAALGVALASGVLAGPLSYVDVAAATTQDPSRWLTRTGFFVVIGLVMSSLVRPMLPSISDEVRRIRGARTITRALDDGQLFLRFQPVVDLRTGGLFGVEALVRWQHPEQGELAPGEFLAMAEQSEAIHDLGAFVLEEACRHAVRWTQSDGSGPCVSVNMSARELESPNVVERVRDILERTGVKPSRICLEVTESVLVADIDLAVARLAGLKTLGVRVAVDDFGTGYSSLASAYRYPIDLLKVDRSFVATLDSHQDAEAVLGGLVLFARSMDVVTVAEGIETADHAALLGELGFDLGQGFHFARPMLADDVDQLIAELPTVDVEPRAVDARPRHVDARRGPHGDR